MTRLRDHYELSAKENAVDTVRRMRTQEYYAAWAIYVSCYDASGDVTGSLCNTVLHAFVAAPLRYEHLLRNVPPYSALRVQAWSVLSGDYRKRLLQVIARQQREQEAKD